MKKSAKSENLMQPKFFGGALGRLTVTFDGGERNVLQGDIPIGKTGLPLQIEAGIKTITLSTPEEGSTTPGTDFTPPSHKVLLKAGEEVHVVFSKR
jgi:hypothetical protein